MSIIHPQGCMPGAALEPVIDVETALDNDTENVTLPSVKAMKSEELYFALDEAETEISQLKSVVKQLDERLKNIKEEADKEEEMGASYRMTHIQEVKADDRLVGRRGLRLKVYENGSNEGEFVYYFNLREAARGVGDKQKLLQRLLDELSMTRRSDNSQPRLTAVAQRLYNKFGKEITDVWSLEYDQEVWVSWGEPFISPFTYCLEVFYNKAVKGTSTDGADHILRDPMVDPEIMALTKDHTKWEASMGFPVMFEEEAALQSKAMQENVDFQKEHMELDRRATFLLLKDNNKVVMYPELALNEKPRRGHSESQLWVISKSGLIYNKGIPQLCLTVSDTRMEGRLFGRETAVEGFVVSLQKKMTGNPSQIWSFATNGTVSSEAYPQLALTYLGNKFGDDESYNENKPQGLLSGMRAYLIITDHLSKKDAVYQRFGVKQERFDNLGQWKHTDVANPEWNKQALSWPVKQDGELNEKYDWPMEGFLQAFAPPLQKSKKDSGFTVLPQRLMVVKNGESGQSEAVAVVGPNLTTMLKQAARDKKPEKGKKNRAPDEIETEIDSLNIHCMDYSVHELEFVMFLDSCTMLLHLPSAARRLFDENGQELFSLQGLKRDQVVFVSCGEGWTDPKLTREEQQRRVLLSQLAADVGKIKQYCSQRDPHDFVLEVEGSLATGSRLVLGKLWSRRQAEEEQQAQQQQLAELESSRCSSDMQDLAESEDTSGMTAHERAHLLSEQRANALKWPWERVVNIATSLDASDMEAQKYSDRNLYDKFKPKPPPSVPRDINQQLVYEDGYIASAANRNLVLAACFQEGRSSEVILAKRLPDDISQRWLILDNGEIRSRYNQKQVLSVTFPSDLETRGETRSNSLDGCVITLQNRRVNQFGHAHQRWRYDAETGYITAFHTDLPDKEITAASMSDVCTFAIAGAVEIDQPGYKAEADKRKGNKTILVCLSCARAMRGRFRLEALPPGTPFSCAMGEAKKHRLPQMGSFRVLNGKVDLSTHEAEITLQSWEEQLDNLRQETASHIYNKINAARTVTTVKVMAYKNGEGRMRPGEIVCGSTVEGILNQCTTRLGLNTASRRLYSEDGTILLDIDDIVEYAITQYRNALADKLEAFLDKDGQRGDVNLEADNRDAEARLEQMQQAAREHKPALANVDLFSEDNERAEGDPSERAGEEEAEEGSKDTREDGKGDSMEDNKIARRREELLSRVELPPLDVILRYPIEVWVSSGKSFVAPEIVESKEENRRKKRAVQSKVCLELDVEKHCLRQMKGRRFKDRSPGRYRSTLSEKQPVVLEGHWQDATIAEHDKHHSVNKLQGHLGEILSNHKRDRSHIVGINMSGPLYKQPVMKRILAYPNGDSPEHAQMVWGETMTELLDNTTLKLALWKKARCFYTEDGKRIETIDAIQPEQLLCASTGKAFIKPQSVRTAVEIRANWGRARKQYGPQATDIGVKIQKNPKVGVDPFGPPELALPLTGGKQTESTA